MKRYIYLFLFSVGAFYCTPQAPKRKILIFSSSGGGGQISIDKALHQTLQDDYNVHTRLFIEASDPISKLTLGYCSGEGFYNYAQKKRYNRLVQGMYEASRWYYYLFANSLIEQTVQLLQKEKPDLVISIIPIVNDIIAKSCKQLDIPLLIIPPDLDVGFYVQDMQPPYSDKLHIALPFDNAMSRRSMDTLTIPNKRIHAFQYPLRHDFYETKDISAIKREFGITDDHPVLLLIMGAQGNRASLTFAQELASAQEPFHLLVCIGKNEEVRNKIEAITFPKHITPQVIGYTDRISDIMAISDLMISKTGAISTVEALYSGVPIIADQTEYVLSWELFHQKFLEQNKCGLILKKLPCLAPMVDDLLKDKQQISSLKTNIKNLVNSQSKESIKPIIHEILRPS